MAGQKPSNDPDVLDAPKLPDIDEDSPGPAADVIEPPPEDAEEVGVVRYLGLFRVRQITSEEWDLAGVPNQDGVMWTKETGNTLPIDLFTDKALEKMTEMGEFQIVPHDE